MIATVAQEQSTGRVLRCRYLRRGGDRCTNEIAGTADDDVLLCPKHLFEAHRQFVEAAEAVTERKVQ